MKKIKILLVVMVIISVLFFWILYNTSNTINTLQTLKTWMSKADPLWWAKSTISSVVAGILDILKDLFGIV